MDYKKRVRAGIAASASGIVLNLILASAKITVGILFGLVSVIADGFNNLSDCGSSAVTLVSFKIAEKPADKKHPYGHRRAEYIASMIIGFLVLFVAAELFRESVVKIYEKTYSADTYIVYIALGASVCVKAVMAVIFGIQAKKIKSDALRASSVDSACDCLATFAVAAGLLITRFTSVIADGWLGALVALFIGWQGIIILKRAGSELLGQAPDPNLVNSVRSHILSNDRVIGIHDLRIYGLGRDYYVATVHIEMDSSLPSLESHGILDSIERLVSNDYGINLTAHLDPVDLGDEEALELEKKVRDAVEGTADGLELHDFRLVHGTNKKLIFEAGVPFSCPHTDGELHEIICKAVRSVSDCQPVVSIERE